MDRLHRALALGTITGFLLPAAACTEQQPATDDDTSVTEDDDDSTAATDDDSTPDDGIPDHYRGLYVGLQLDGAGVPVVAFYDKDWTGVGLASLSGGKWVRRAPPELGNPISKEKAWQDGNDFGKYLSFAIASGTWHLAFQDVSGEKLMYASSPDGKAWTAEVADSTGDGGYFASLAVDGSGNPGICHYDRSGRSLRFARKSGGSWSAAVVDEGTPGPAAEDGTIPEADVGQYCSVASDGANWRIAYYDAANGDLRLATGSPGAFTSATVDTAGDVGAWPTLFHASTGWVLAYHAPGDQDLKLARESGGSWTTAVVDDGDYVGADSSVTEVSGKLTIAYFDGVNNDVKLATETGSGWGVRSLGSAAEESDFVGAVGYSNNVVAAPSGKLHVATFRYDIGDFVHVETSP